MSEVRRGGAGHAAPCAAPPFDRGTRGRKEARLTGAEIRFLRKHLGWSGEDFAGVLSVRPETVSRWENEKEPMGRLPNGCLRLFALRERPVTSYPNERLADVAKSDARPMHLQARSNRSGWHIEHAA